MITAFFLDKFEYDFRCNQRWIEILQKHEDDLTPYIFKSFSHVVNVHHIWMHRLLEIPAESFTWDLLPIDYWEPLAQENHLKTIDFLEKQELNNKINYTSEEGIAYEKEIIDILYHILNHSNYHRAQISRDLRTLDIQPPAFNFISFH